MKMRCLLILLLVVLLLLGCDSAIHQPQSESVLPMQKQTIAIKLPEPRMESQVSVEEALLQRRSVREYADVKMTLAELAQLLWAAQGITSERGGRTAPSAGALYPLEIYLAAGNVESLSTGVYKYKAERHELDKVRDGDVRSELCDAALGQVWVSKAAIDIVITAVYERTTTKYGDRGVRYVHMEAGHAAQNICLQAVALNLGTVTVGAFNDDQLKSILTMSNSEVPLYLIPVGKKH